MFKVKPAKRAVSKKPIKRNILKDLPANINPVVPNAPDKYRLVHPSVSSLNQPEIKGDMIQEQIKEYIKQGMSTTYIAETFGIDKATIKEVKSKYLAEGK